MSYKRPRNVYETDSQSQESPFVTYGTPLPPFDAETRDDGSYVPVWQQEVRDEQGRKRLHGAFTGGFSAGYFNTVGSKDGWTPSTFVSSRTNRRKDDAKQGVQRPEDFMDDEDHAEAAEAQDLHTSQTFSALGSTGEDEKRKGFLMDLFRNKENTVGVRLLQKMGWRQGQGIGPRVRRKAQLGENAKHDRMDVQEHLFAPKNSAMITFVRKDDRKGLGYSGENRLGSISVVRNSNTQSEEDDDEQSIGLGSMSRKPETKLQAKPIKSGIGVGVLNDLGSDDDDDPYEMGPKISYGRVIGGDKQKMKTKASKPKLIAQSANPLLKTKPVFLSRKAMPAGFRKCQDGRLPLPGFILADPSVQLVSTGKDERWPRPKIPEGWMSTKHLSITSATSSEPLGYLSTAEAARASTLNPRTRAAVLGEAQLPGKSIFDFLSTTARERIASVTGKTNLPPALNEAPSQSKTSGGPITSSSTGIPNRENDIPTLDESIALAALSRGVGGWTPYAEDPTKLARYRSFLEYRAGLSSSLPANHRPTDLTRDAYIQELHEFAHAARVFKPMTGMMASRFTSSSVKPTSNLVEDAANEQELLRKPAQPDEKPEDPAEAAARMGMFGPMTRSVTTFAPTRLVCKRFGVKPPSHVQPDAVGSADVPVSGANGRGGGAGGGGGGGGGTGTSDGLGRNAWAPPDLVSQDKMREMASEAGYAQRFESAGSLDGGKGDPPETHEGNVRARTGAVIEEAEVDAERNDALEGKRAGDAVFKAIFGSDDEDG